MICAVLVTIPITASADGYYDYRVKNYQYQNDQRILKRLNLHPWTMGGPGVSLYYETRGWGGPARTARWTWFPLKHLGGGKYVGYKSTKAWEWGSPAYYAETVWLEQFGNGTLKIRYELLTNGRNPDGSEYDKHLGTETDTMYLYDQRWW